MKNSSIILLFLCIHISLYGIAQCSNSSEKSKIIVLDFTNCLLNEKKYDKIILNIPKRFIKKRVIDYHGFCEYSFKYDDGSIIYVCTDIYNGSYLNYNNRMSLDINTYAKLRSIEPIDTIKNYGMQQNGKYWLEYILGDIVIGYLNVPSEFKELFDNVIPSLKRKKDSHNTM